MEATKANTLAVREESETLKRELERLDTQRVRVSFLVVRRLTRWNCVAHFGFAAQSELGAVTHEQARLKKDMAALEKYQASLLERSSRVGRQVEEFKRKHAQMGESAHQMVRTREPGLRCDPCTENTEKERAQERESLQQQVAAQGLTDLEIQRLTSDRHQLDEAYRATSARLTEATQAANDLEVELQRAFGKIEKLAEDYHSKAAKLGLLPTGPDGFEDVDFAQELNGASTTPQGIVPDCTTRIRPAIVSMKQAVMKQRHSSTSEIFNVESDVAKLAEAVANVSSEIVEWEGRWQRVTKELNDAKEVRLLSLRTRTVSIGSGWR
jgi:kinetochore protein NDC80